MTTLEYPSAKANMAEGTIGIVTVTSGGTGHITPPLITFNGPVGVGTTASGSYCIN